MAPELVANPSEVNEKCDIWSMGVVMWEMVMLEVPFQELSDQQILMGLMQGNLPPHTPASCEEEWRQLIDICMLPNPSKRPSFKELAQQLSKLLEALDYNRSMSQ
jgi:serine/threonine protein kinase